MLRAIILLSKGILRDQRLRRSAMFWVMGVAVAMLFLGRVLMSDRWAREHWLIYFIYWAACAWLTLTGVLLALLDMLLIRAAARAMRRQIETQFAGKHLNDNDR